MTRRFAVGGPLLGYPRVYREALAVHDAFRRLGFAPDNILVGPGADGVHVVLQHRGQEFRVTLGPASPSFEKFKEKWPKAVAAWNAGTDAQLQAVWEESEVASRVVTLVLALEAKGILVGGKPAGDESPS